MALDQTINAQAVLGLLSTYLLVIAHMSIKTYPMHDLSEFSNSAILLSLENSLFVHM